MKIKALFLAVAVVGASFTASATPLYVGTNLTPKNNVSFGLGYTPTKKNFTGTETGTITNYAVKADYNALESLAIGLDLPFYWANKKATGTKSRFGLGNMGLSANWNQRLSATSDDVAYGYSISVPVYFPTANKNETGVVRRSSVALDLVRFSQKWTSVVPTAGLFIENEMFMAKFNSGLAFSYISKDSLAIAGLTGRDKSRFNIPTQLGLSYKVMPNFSVNAEYNTMYLDKSTKTQVAIGAKQSRFRQVASPSISGNFNEMTGQVYANIPVDATSRKANAVAAGLNLGYTF